MKRYKFLIMAFMYLVISATFSSCKDQGDEPNDDNEIVKANAEGIRFVIQAEGINMWGGTSGYYKIYTKSQYLWINTRKNLVLDYWDESQLWLGNGYSFSWSFNYYTFTMDKAEELINSLYGKSINEYPALKALYDYIGEYQSYYKYITMTQPYAVTGEIILFNQTLDIRYE